MASFQNMGIMRIARAYDVTKIPIGLSLQPLFHLPDAIGDVTYHLYLGKYTGSTLAEPKLI